MLGSKAVIALPIEPVDFLGIRRRNPFGGRLAEPAIDKPAFTLLLVAAAPTAKCSLIDP